MRARGLLFLLAFLFFALLHLGAAPAPTADEIEWMSQSLLSGKNIKSYSRALKRFADLPDPRVLPTLLKLTEGDNPIARTEAAGVLWHYDTQEVRDRLVVLLKDRRHQTRIEAAKSLCILDFGAHRKIIVDALRDGSQPIRRRALRSLAELKGPEAADAVRRFQPRTTEDRVWAAYARYRLEVNRQAQLRELEHLAAPPRQALLPGLPDPSLDDLRRAAEAAQAGDLRQRLLAVQALGRIGDEPALALVAVATGDRALLELPGGAADQLLLQPDAAGPALVRALADQRPLVRIGAAQTARLLPAEAEQARTLLAPALAKATNDSARLVRLAGMRAIAALGLTDRASAIARNLKASDPGTRRVAALALGGLGDDRTLEPLVKALERESDDRVRRSLYQGIALLKSPRTFELMLDVLKRLLRELKASRRASSEMSLCIKTLGSAGDEAAQRVLQMLPDQTDDHRAYLLEVLAQTGSAKAVDFFLEQLREEPPAPDSPAVRFWDSLGQEYRPRLKTLIESEKSMWTRVILARTLFRLGESDFGRGILWALRHEEQYFRRLGATVAFGLRVPGAADDLTRLLRDEPETAWLAARSLIGEATPAATRDLLAGIQNSTLRERRKVPVRLFWEGQSSGINPFSKLVEGERVWVLFAEDRIGGKLDLHLTWSSDDRTWTAPIFTGLTSFSDIQGRVPPPTFSLDVSDRRISIALTRSIAGEADPKNPRFRTERKLHRFALQDLYRDRDGDGLSDVEETARFTNPARADSDGDGLPDGQDKNPLAPPPQRRDEDVLRFLAFSYALLVVQAAPMESRLLVVEDDPAGRRAPELAVWPWIVLHLRPEQERALWTVTGGGYPVVRFQTPAIDPKGKRAVQGLSIGPSGEEPEQLEVVLENRDGQWVVTKLRELD